MMFNIIPLIALNAVPDKMTGPIAKTAPPRPITNITLAIIKLRALEKSNCSSIITFKPLLAITPYNNREIPPITASGIVDSIAVNFPKKLNRIAIIAAFLTTLTEAIRVRPITPTFSP